MINIDVCVLIVNHPFALYSDGLGRTGTFCALMLCHERLLTEHMADVFNTIRTMRAQRPGMVENPVRKFSIITMCALCYALYLETI